MILRPRLILAAVIFALCLSLGTGLSAAAPFNPLDRACNQSTNTAGDGSVCQAADQQGTEDPIAGSDGIIAKAGRIISVLIGVASVIMLIIGGLAFVTSGGKAESVAKARSRIIYAIVGLMVAGLAWAIITFVTGRLL